MSSNTKTVRAKFGQAYFRNGTAYLRVHTYGDTVIDIELDDDATNGIRQLLDELENPAVRKLLFR